MTGRQQIVVLNSVLSSVKKSNPVYRVKRHPVWPPGLTPVSLPPGAVPEWGVYGPGTSNHDLTLDFSKNRDKFAEKVSIPGLIFSQGTD